MRLRAFCVADEVVERRQRYLEARHQAKVFLHVRRQDQFDGGRSQDVLILLCEELLETAAASRVSSDDRAANVMRFEGTSILQPSSTQVSAL